MSLNEKEEIINIAKELPEWFTPEAIKQITLDLTKYSVLVEREKTALGFIIYDILDKKCLIKWMAVKKGLQRKGIGRKLIEQLVEICKKRSIEFIETDTLAETEDYEPYILTRAFYHSAGFKDVEIVRAGYPEGSDKLILRKELV